MDISIYIYFIKLSGFKTLHKYMYLLQEGMQYYLVRQHYSKVTGRATSLCKLLSPDKHLSIRS